MIESNKEVGREQQQINFREGFTDSSVGKQSACNAGDPGSIPGLGRSSEEGKGYPLQYSGLENPMDYTVQRLYSTVQDYTCKESDTTERLTFKLQRGGSQKAYLRK